MVSTHMDLLFWSVMLLPAPPPTDMMNVFLTAIVYFTSNSFYIEIRKAMD